MTINPTRAMIEGMRTLIIALALSGCAVANNSPAVPPDAADQAIEQWQDFGNLPWDDRCYDEQATLAVGAAEDACFGPHDTSCFAYTDHTHTPTIYISDQPDAAVWQHELRHWLVACTGLDAAGDQGHGICQLWPGLCSPPN